MGKLYKHFASRLTGKDVGDEIMEFGEGGHGSEVPNGESRSGGEVAEAAVLSPSRVSSSVNTIIDTNGHHLMLGHFHTSRLKRFSWKTGIASHDQLQTSTACSMSKRIWHPVTSKSAFRSDHCLGRVFADVVGLKKLKQLLAKDML